MEKIQESSFESIDKNIVSTLYKIANRLDNSYSRQINKIAYLFSLAVLEKIAKIVKRKDGWYVISDSTGKNLGGPYKSKKKAKERLRQVEFFKRKKSNLYFKKKAETEVAIPIMFEKEEEQYDVISTPEKMLKDSFSFFSNKYINIAVLIDDQGKQWVYPLNSNSEDLIEAIIDELNRPTWKVELDEDDKDYLSQYKLGLENLDYAFFSDGHIVFSENGFTITDIYNKDIFIPLNNLDIQEISSIKIEEEEEEEEAELEDEEEEIEEEVDKEKEEEDEEGIEESEQISEIREEEDIEDETSIEETKEDDELSKERMSISKIIDILKVADQLDIKGYTKYASKLDNIVAKFIE